MKVLLICPLGSMGGGMFRVAEYLRSGLASSPNAPSLEILDIRGSGSLLSTPLVFMKARSRLHELMRARSVDLVHLFIGDQLSLLRKCAFARIASGLGLPYILHMHAAELEPFLRKLPASVLGWVADTFKRAAQVIVLGENARELMAASLGIDRARISIIPNGVDAPPEWSPVPRRPTVKTLLFTGNLEARKGVHDLLAALALPRVRRLRLRALFAGDGDIPRHNQHARDLGIEDGVQFLGWRSRSEITALLQESQMLVLPSYAEALPLAVVEALGHGVPVVTTAVGEIPRYLTDDEGVRFVRPGDTSMIADAIVDIATDDALATRLACAGRCAFEQHFSIEQFLHAFVEVYRSCLTDVAARNPAAASSLGAAALTRP